MKKKQTLSRSLPKESIEEDYGKEDPDTICGFGTFKPNWLRSWATPRTYLALLTIAALLNYIFNAYQDGVMSSLEKRFAFKSKTTGDIVAANEITPLFLGVLVGYYGGKCHRPRALALCTFVSALCCFISALPYFIYGPGRDFGDLNSFVSKNGSDLQLCHGAVVEDCGAGDDRSPDAVAVFLLMLAGFLRGFGSLTLNVMGFSYMDDNARKKNIPMYLAITFVLRWFGRFLGPLLSSMCLKYFENPLDDPGYGPDDPRWVGAWWLGFVLEGFLFLLVTVPIAMLPKRLPGFKKPVDTPGTDTRVNFSGMFVDVKRMLLNPLLWAIMLNDVLTNNGRDSHSSMLPKYMEQQFRLNPSDASLYSGVLGFGAIMLAVFIGGYLIFKFRPTMKFLLCMMIVTKIIGASGYIALMIPKCEKLEMANFGMDNEGLILEGSCNMNCNCSRKSFTPVCGSDLKTNYFSACYAGCEHHLNETFFNKCSCISTKSSDVKLNYATQGFCMPEGCWLQALSYLIAWPAIQFIENILYVTMKLTLLRCIQPEDKSIALGTFEAVTCLLGLISINLITFDAMADSACLVWESSCGKTGSCWFYDVDMFSNIKHGMSAGYSFLAAGAMYLIFCMRGRFCDLYEDEEKKKR